VPPGAPEDWSWIPDLAQNRQKRQKGPPSGSKSRYCCTGGVLEGRFRGPGASGRHFGMVLGVLAGDGLGTLQEARFDPPGGPGRGRIGAKSHIRALFDILGAPGEPPDLMGMMELTHPDRFGEWLRARGAPLQKYPNQAVFSQNG
jgi:hypothetical protein